MYYGIEWSPYGVASYPDGSPARIVVVFRNRRDRDQWVAAAAGIPRTQRGYRERVQRSELLTRELREALPPRTEEGHHE